MDKIIEIVVVQMNDDAEANLLRKKAKEDFLSFDGLERWDTYVSVEPNKEKIYAEVLTFADEAASSRLAPTFTKRETTKAYYDGIKHIVLGRFFKAVDINK
jgi:hypothetical protein